MANPSWNYPLALILLWVTPALWSTNYFVARAAPGHIEAHLLAFLRWFMVFLILFPFAYKELRAAWPLTTFEKKDAVITGAMGMWICGAIVYLAGQTTTALNIGLLYALSPVLIAIASVRFLGERFSPRQSIGVALAMLGMIWIVTKGHPMVLADLEIRPGDLWILLAVVSWAGYSIRMKAVSSRFTPVTRLTVITVGGLFVLLPFTLLEWFVVTDYAVTLEGLSLAVLAALLPGVFSYLAYAFMQKELGAARSGTVLYLGPFYAGLISWLLLNEPPSDFHFVGGAFILLGIFWVSRAPR
jgi:drug/metabolite transporter (DMT)-like permease